MSACHAGQFTLKELETVKALFKNNIDFVVSDKPVRIDATPTWQLQQDQLHQGAPAPAQPGAGGWARAHAEPPQGLPQNLQQDQQQHVQPHRMLHAEEFNATWGLDLLDQPSLPLDHIFHYTHNGMPATAQACMCRL